MSTKPKVLVAVQQMADREARYLRPLADAGLDIIMNRTGRALTAVAPRSWTERAAFK